MNPSSWTFEDSLHSRSLSFYDSHFIYDCTTYIVSRRTHSAESTLFLGGFSARCVATNRTRTVENTTHILLAACLLERVYRAVAKHIMIMIYIKIKNSPYNYKEYSLFVKYSIRISAW
jgi:hypothetical protein